MTPNDKKLRDSVLFLHSNKVTKASSSTDGRDEESAVTKKAPDVQRWVSMKASTKITPVAFSLADFESTQVMSSMRANAVNKINTAEETPMLVIPLENFFSFGKIPRISDNLTRPKIEHDIAVFISHRWWGENKPDNDDNLKYHTLCRGLRSLINGDKTLKKERKNVVIWMDFACVEQDDKDKLMQGENGPTL